ncbi:MAG: hypothetical protein M1826_000979 [Phylliscum demangeonii]|nr:MAG: hypothetical protein M1826_000979 [Phylliscum demangeonii]
MALRRLILARATAPVAVCGLLTAGTAVFSTSVAFAEAPELLSKKPIYDDYPPQTFDTSAKVTDGPSAIQEPIVSSAPLTTPKPSPTDRLAERIRHGRLFLYAHAAMAERELNGLMSSLLDAETSFTKTVASLAPPRASGEQLMPGAIYVVVAAMAGSIMSRNRTFLLRAAVPLTMGIGASWLILPITTRNVADLVWRLEQRSPVLRDNHLRIRRTVDETWQAATERSKMALQTIDETVRSGREGLEEWVRKGR